MKQNILLGGIMTCVAINTFNSCVNVSNYCFQESQKSLESFDDVSKLGTQNNSYTNLSASFNYDRSFASLGTISQA